MEGELMSIITFATVALAAFTISAVVIYKRSESESLREHERIMAGKCGCCCGE